MSITLLILDILVTQRLRKRGFDIGYEGVCAEIDSLMGSFFIYLCVAHFVQQLRKQPASCDPHQFRPRPMGKDTYDFLCSADPQKTPFWVLFGFILKTKTWNEHYQLRECPNLGGLQQSARDFMRISENLAWRAWPDPYRWRSQGHA